MKRREGFTLLEVLALGVVGGVVALVVMALRPAEKEHRPIDCMSNVRNIVGLLECAPAMKYPEYDGPNLILYLVKRGEIDGEQVIRILFCPTDEKESFERAVSSS